MVDLHGVAILQVLPRMEVGGAERTTLDVAAALAKAGAAALVASAGGRLVGDLEACGARHCVLPGLARRDPVSIASNARALAALAEAEGVALFHVRSRAPAWSVRAAGRRLGAPYVATFHGGAPRGAVKRAYTRAMVEGAGVIANSAFTGRALTRAYGAARLSGMRIIPRGVDLEAFDPARVSAGRRRAATERFGENASSDINLILPARLSARKGHALAIEALARWKSARPTGVSPNLKLIFIGGASGRREAGIQTDRAKLENAVRKAGVGDCVSFAGDWSDMPAAHLWADGALAPSLAPEPFGRAAIEAGAMGRAAIVSGEGGLAEIVRHGETGLHARPRDAQSLSDAFEAFTRMDGEARLAMGAAARARVEREYSAARMTARTLAFYEDVLSAHARGLAHGA